MFTRMTAKEANETYERGMKVWLNGKEVTKRCGELIIGPFGFGAALLFNADEDGHLKLKYDEMGEPFFPSRWYLGRVKFFGELRKA